MHLSSGRGASSGVPPRALLYQVRRDRLVILREHVIPSGVVVEEGALCRPRGTRDLFDGDGLVPAFANHGNGRVVQPSPSVSLLRVAG